mgnify:FL=1
MEPPIVIVIGGQRFELTRDEARALRDGIEAIIGPKVAIRGPYSVNIQAPDTERFVARGTPMMIEVNPKGNQA